MMMNITVWNRISRIATGFRTCQICGSSFASQKFASRANSSNTTQAQITTHSLLQSTMSSSDSLILTRWPKFKPNLRQPRTAWIEQLDAEESGYPAGFVNLHPDIWATYPRLDILRKVVKWQEWYRKVQWQCVPNRGELIGGGPKPWPQKGMGKARQGSDRAPQWRGGGKVFGPRGPMSYYTPMSKSVKCRAIRVALTCKYLQDDVKFVTDYSSFTFTGSNFLSGVREARNWGDMVLFVGNKERSDLSESFRSALQSVKDVHYLPVSMFNAYALMTFPTVVFDIAALDELESRLLFQMHKFSDNSLYPGQQEVFQFVKRLCCDES